MTDVGSKAPDFAMATDGGKTVSLADFAGRALVLYFYPKDDTPGCTVEATDFTAKIDAFTAAGAAVLGVSRDTVASHCKFRDKHKLKVPLGSDPDFSVHRAYGAFGEKKQYGRTFEGCIRSTFVIGPDGKIAHRWSPVKVPGHVDAVLAAVQSLSKAAPTPAPAAPAESKPEAKKPAAKKPAAKKPAAKKTTKKG